MIEIIGMHGDRAEGYFRSHTGSSESRVPESWEARRSGSMTIQQPSQLSKYFAVVISLLSDRSGFMEEIEPGIRSLIEMFTIN